MPRIGIWQVLVTGLEEVGSDKNIYFGANTMLKENSAEEYVALVLPWSLDKPIEILIRRYLFIFVCFCQ